MARTRYRFITRLTDTPIEGGILVWESVAPIPGDSRHEQIRVPADWFWSARRGFTFTHRVEPREDP